MNIHKQGITSLRMAAALAGLLAGGVFSNVAQAAFDFFQTGATGSGQQFAYAPTNSISGTMTAAVPRFDGNLGTLVQADFEFAGSITGTWVAVGNPGGVSTFSLSGPTDVDGQPIGTLAVSFTGPYDNIIGSNDFDADYSFLSLTSGAFFDSLTGPGTVLMSWNYSGSNSLSTFAAGTGVGGEGFSWGGSVHVLYIYVPEPSSFLLGTMGWLGLVAIARKRGR